jgi:three-Cys-motif partner protein
MHVPADYHGREQTYLKHRVLEEYLNAWGHMLGSVARNRPVRLWYVDCFAGPWQAVDEALGDTSISIGLQALEKASKTWGSLGFRVDVEAIFVERNEEAYQRLMEHLAHRPGTVRTHPMRGEFGARIEDIKNLIGRDAAFLFVDPTGWKGAAMRFIEPLMGKLRDVLINVMFNHVHRFIDDPRSFLREQMRDFFGLREGDIAPNLDEEGMFSFYRTQLKKTCRLRYSADLAVPHPTNDRTWFRLVVGGNHPAAIELFRTVEHKIVGVEAGSVREDARRRRREEKAPQLELHLSSGTDDRRYQGFRDAGLHAIDGEIERLLAKRSARPFNELWPTVLEAHHVTKADVARRVCELHRKGRLLVRGLGPREKTVKDEHLVARTVGATP